MCRTTRARAQAPDPPHGATNTSRRLTLAWTAGMGAQTHLVHLGRVPPAVDDPPLAESTSTALETEPLFGGTTYYWRVDERNTAGTTVGETWQFTTGGVPADLDADDDVDQTDFGQIQACLTGPFEFLANPACEPADLNADRRVEARDLAIFLACLSGAGVPADPLCHP